MCGKGWSGCDALCNVVVGGAAIFGGFVYIPVLPGGKFSEFGIC